MEVTLLKKWSKSALSQISVLDCIVLHNICIEKKFNHSLDLTFNENNNKSKSSEDNRKNLKMVSGLNTGDTFKGGASFRNDICGCLWFKKQYYEDC